MTFYKKMKFMEERPDNGPAYIFALIQPGDWTVDNGWKFTVTQAAKDCDCGKGMYCPLIEQTRYFKGH